MSKQFAIPGLQNPKEPKKFDERVFNEPDGSIDIPVYGPIAISELNAPPIVEAYISSDTIREKYVHLADNIGCFLHSITSESYDSEIYYLRIPKDQIELPRGSYRLCIGITPENGKTIEKNFSLVIRTHPKDGKTYNWVGI